MIATFEISTSEDILVFDTIPCFIPKEIRTMLDGRTLIVFENELRFTPELPFISSQNGD